LQFADVFGEYLPRIKQGRATSLYADFERIRTLRCGAVEFFIISFHTATLLTRVASSWALFEFISFGSAREQRHAVGASSPRREAGTMKIRSLPDYSGHGT
jgi:hypothetical protein